MPQTVTDIITTDRAVANSDKRLSICLRPNGFSFSVFTNDRLLLTVGDIKTASQLPPDQLVQLVLATEGIDGDTLDYRQMRLIIPTMQSVWIPAHLYDPSLDRQYLNTVCQPDPEQGIFRTFSPSLNAHLVFTAPTSTVLAFKIAMPGIDVMCQHSILVDTMMSSATSSHPSILLHVRPQAADIQAFYNGRLLLSNSFPAQNHDEALYHALSVMKHLHLETPDMELSICGLVDRDFYTQLQHFFPTVLLHTGTPFTFLNPDFQTLHTYLHTLILS